MRASLLKPSALLLACALAVGWYVWRTGPLVNARFGHDVPIVLDGAWRVLNGQVPNVDFHSLFGPLFFLLAALGMVLVGPSVDALVATNLVLFFVLGAWAWVLASRRAHPITAAFFAALVGLVVVGAYHLGFDHRIVTYANLYNRYGYALLYLLVFERLFPPRAAGERQVALGAASSGFILVALLFLKVTFFVVALGFVVLAALVRGRVEGWRGLLAGAAAAFLPMAVYVRFEFGAMLRDYVVPILVRRDVVASPAFVMEKVFPSRIPLAALAGATALLLVSPMGWVPRLRAVALIAGGVVAGVALNLTNYGAGDMPLLSVIALVPIEQLLRNAAWPAKPGRLHRLLPGLLVALAAVAEGRFVYRNVASLPYARHLRTAVAPDLDRITEAPLSNFLVIAADGRSNDRYAAKLNEGFALLRANTTPRDRIACLNFENPFSFGLKRPPPAGDVSSWHFGYGFDRRRHWPAEEVFRDVSVVLIPREPDEETVTPLLEIYGGYLAARYDVVATSPRWTLARRR